MAGLLGQSGTVTGGAGLTTSFFNQLIALRLQQEKSPLTRLETEKSELNVRRALFVDTKILLSSLNSLALDLKNTSTSVFNSKAITSSDTAVLTASGGSGAVLGAYNLSVTTLAKAHRVRSDPQATVDQALNQSGTFVLGGAASRAVSGAVTVANTVDAFGVGTSIRSGQKELGSGAHYVEVRNYNGTYQFRVVDGYGRAVSIDKASDTGTAMTADWQDLSLVSGTTFDTARGLTITFGSGAYTTGSKGAGAASVTYTAQGATLNVSSADSLTAIRDAINAATYAEGNEVQASILDNALVLTAAATGAQHTLAAADTIGTVLQNLGVLNAGAFKTELQPAADAIFTVNGLTVTRSRNTGLDDVIGGVSLNLLKEAASATVTVKPDTTAITEKISAFLRKLNEALDYLKAKTQTEANQTAKTYKRGGLAGESVFGTLRADLIAMVRGKMPGAASSALDELADLGIGLDKTLHFAVTDSAKLQAAIESNLSGVTSLVDNRMAALEAKLAPFVKATTGALDSRIASADKRSAQIDARVAQLNKRSAALEKELIRRYGDILGQVPRFTQQQASAGVLLARSTFSGLA